MDVRYKQGVIKKKMMSYYSKQYQVNRHKNGSNHCSEKYHKVSSASTVNAISLSEQTLVLYSYVTKYTAAEVVDPTCYLQGNVL